MSFDGMPPAVHRGLSEGPSGRPTFEKVGSKLFYEERVRDALERLARSEFRAKFRICDKDRTYALTRGRELIAEHTRDFIEKRLAPAYIPKDGRQTPMRGHPTFTAQHATATCCRGCLEKWHRIEKGRALSDPEKDFVCELIGEWIDRQMGQWE